MRCQAVNFNVSRSMLAELTQYFRFGIIHFTTNKVRCLKVTQFYVKVVKLIRFLSSCAKLYLNTQVCFRHTYLTSFFVNRTLLLINYIYSIRTVNLIKAGKMMSRQTGNGKVAIWLLFTLNLRTNIDFLLKTMLAVSINTNSDPSSSNTEFTNLHIYVAKFQTTYKKGCN